MFGIRKKNIVNLITLVSIIGVLFGTMAMVVVLSIFNGFDSIIKELYNQVDSDFKIEHKDGVVFELSRDSLSAIYNIEGVIDYSEVLESKLLAQYLDKQLVVNAKAVDDNYYNFSGLKNSILLGDYVSDKPNFIVVGNGVFHSLELNLLDFDNHLKLSFFKEPNSLNLSQSIISHSFYVSGVVGTRVEFDDTYVVLQIDDLRRLLDLPGQCSSIEIKVDESINRKFIRSQLTSYFGDTYLIQNRLEQRPFVFKMVKTEKLAVYIIFSFIVFVSMLSLVASLIVLLMAKQKDILILYELGLPIRKIKIIFFQVGVFITLIGSAIGGFLGLFVCLIQERFKIIKLGENMHFIDSYPVKFDFFDLIMIQLIVISLGFISSYLVTGNNNFYSYH